MATITITTDTPREHDWRVSQESSPTSQPDETPPSHAINIAPRWNESKTTIWRLSATFWCGLMMGANDAAYGAIIPYVRIELLRQPGTLTTDPSSSNSTTGKPTPSSRWSSCLRSWDTRSRPSSATPSTSISVDEVSP